MTRDSINWCHYIPKFCPLNTLDPISDYFLHAVHEVYQTTFLMQFFMQSNFTEAVAHQFYYNKPSAQ